MTYNWHRIIGCHNLALVNLLYLSIISQTVTSQYCYTVSSCLDFVLIVSLLKARRSFNISDLTSSILGISSNDTLMFLMVSVAIFWSELLICVLAPACFFSWHLSELIIEFLCIMCLDMSSPKTSDNIKNNKNDSKIIHLSLSTSVVRSQQLFTMPHHVWQCLAVSCPSVNVTLCLKLSFKETVLYIFIKLQTNIYTCTWRTTKQSLIFFYLDFPLYCKWRLLNYTQFPNFAVL